MRGALGICCSSVGLPQDGQDYSWSALLLGFRIRLAPLWAPVSQDGRSDFSGVSNISLDVGAGGVHFAHKQKDAACSYTGKSESITSKVIGGCSYCGAICCSSLLLRYPVGDSFCACGHLREICSGRAQKQVASAKSRLEVLVHGRPNWLKTFTHLDFIAI